MVITLTCLTCKEPFQHDAQGGRRPDRCPPCRVERKAEVNRRKALRWREANKEKAREQWREGSRRQRAKPGFQEKRREATARKTYGITQSDYDELLAAQSGVCAICGGGPNGPGTRLHVDHCHDSSRVRGLLCGKCNTAVGLLDDDPERAEALAKYLRQ